MAGLGVVFGKEFVDSLRERRAVVSALVFGPLLGPVLFAVLTSYAVSLQIDEAVQPIDVPVIAGRGAKNLMTHLYRRQIDVDHDRFDDVEALREAVRRGDVDVGLVVAEGLLRIARKMALPRGCGLSLIRRTIRHVPRSRDCAWHWTNTDS